MVSYAPTLASFVIALIISTVIIYVITKVFGEKEGLLTALLAAIVGSVIYALVYYFLGNGMIAAIIAANLIGIIGLVLAAPVLATLRLLSRYITRKLFDLDPWPEPELRTVSRPLKIPWLRLWSRLRTWGRALRQKITSLIT